jgi:molybdenum cofactor cytidylyltransferase
MGRPKPLVPILGQPLLTRVLQTVRSIDPAETIVVLGAGADRIRDQVDLRGITVVVNSEFQDGMGSSIRHGAEAAESKGPLLIVLGDQPFVEPATLQALIRRHAAGEGKILIPTFEGVRGNPILLDRTLLPELDSLRGDAGCSALFPIHAADLVEVPVTDPGILIDVDTPDELARLEELVKSAGSPTEAALRPLITAPDPEEIFLRVKAEAAPAPPASAGPALETDATPRSAAPASIDPVCGMEVETSGPYHSIYKGLVYRFCSEGCLGRFRRAPSRYLPG